MSFSFAFFKLTYGHRCFITVRTSCKQNESDLTRPYYKESKNDWFFFYYGTKYFILKIVLVIHVSKTNGTMYENSHSLHICEKVLGFLSPLLKKWIIIQQLNLKIYILNVTFWALAIT